MDIVVGFLFWAVKRVVEFVHMSVHELMLSSGRDSNKIIYGPVRVSAKRLHISASLA